MGSLRISPNANGQTLGNKLLQNQVGIIIRHVVFNVQLVNILKRLSAEHLYDVRFVLYSRVCSSFHYKRLFKTPSRSEERRVGKECRSQWWPLEENKKEK